MDRDHQDCLRPLGPGQGYRGGRAFEQMIAATPDRSDLQGRRSQSLVRIGVGQVPAHSNILQISLVRAQEQGLGNRTPNEVDSDSWA